MFKLVRWLIGLCNHTWETTAINDYTIENSYTGSKVDGYIYTLRCTKCGNMKAWKNI